MARPALTHDMISEDVEELNLKDVPSRLEMIQRRRLKYMEKIEKNDDFLSDESLSISYMQLLNGFEKQELYKHKSQADKEENDKDRQAYELAAETVRMLRQQRRDEIAHGNQLPVDSPAPPKVEENQEGYSEIADAERNYKEISWTDFHKEMILAGRDPRHMVDEDGNIVRIRNQDDEDEE